jgi:hypothetical protein
MKKTVYRDKQVLDSVWANIYYRIYNRINAAGTISYHQKRLHKLQKWVTDTKFHISIMSGTTSFFDVQSPRSPAVNPVDFYLRLYFRNIVHSAPTANEETPQQWILCANEDH